MNKLIIYLIALNLFGLLIMRIDKKRAQQRKWRISESMIWGVSLVGGSLGTMLGMFLFRHKTKHLTFRIGLPLLFITQVVGLLML